MKFQIGIIMMDIGTSLNETSETELLANIRANNSHSFTILFNRYRPLVCKIWYQFHLTGTGLDDWQQETALVLYHVACNYYDQPVKFCWYFRQALMNRIRDLYRQQAARKRVPSQFIEPLTDVHVETLTVDHHLGPDEVAEFRCSYHHFREECSNLEWNAFIEVNQGYDLGEVAGMLGCTRRCVRSAFERAKKRFIQELA